MSETIETDCHEWAIRCHDRDGKVFTGRPFVTRSEAEASGRRLTQINGAEWWLAQRRRVVTVETFDWADLPTPPATDRAADGRDGGGR